MGLVVWVMCCSAALFRGAEACTNLIVTPGASVDGSSIYAYSADSAALYGTLDRLPGRSNISPGTTKKIWDWDSGVLLGEIDEVEETFDVVGNINEHQLTIGEWQTSSTDTGTRPRANRSHSQTHVNVGFWK